MAWREGGWKFGAIWRCTCTSVCKYCIQDRMHEGCVSVEKTYCKTVAQPEGFADENKRYTHGTKLYM